MLGEAFFNRNSGPFDEFESLRYASPEELNGKGRQLTSPFWVLGIFLYELSFGRHPFANRNPKVMVQLILKYPVYFPEERPISPELEQLILDLLGKDWGQRLGSERFETEILEHAFF